MDNNNTPPAISDIPDNRGRMALYSVTVAASLLLLIAHKGLENDWPLFNSAALVCLWYSCTLVVPFIISFLIREEPARYPWLLGLLSGALVAGLAWHTGGSYSETLNLDAAPIFVPYTLSLAVAVFITLPFLQALRDGPAGISYPRLYQLSWDNALTALAALVFTLACWLILWLWGGLFNVIGISFFKDLFAETTFIYPITGLFTGFGIGLGRAQIGAIRSALNVCLAIARPLLPLICGVALLFLAALTVNDLQALWDTGSATTLLLCLVLGTVTLVNAVFQDGQNPAPYGFLTQWLTRIGVLTLPVFSVIALYAISLRVEQYGWSVARCYAAFIAGVASLYATGYAISSVFSILGRKSWLAWTSNVNIILALVIPLLLLTFQSPMLDLRSLTVKSQLQRVVEAPALLDELDLNYLRFDLGITGYEALQNLHRQLADSDKQHIRAAIQDTLAATHRYEVAGNHQLAADIEADKVKVLPEGKAIPPGLLEYLRTTEENPQLFVFDQTHCSRSSSSCYLIAADITRDGIPEWIFMNSSKHACRLQVLRSDQNSWTAAGHMMMESGCTRSRVESALENGHLTVKPPAYNDLWLGDTRFRFYPSPTDKTSSTKSD